MGILIDKNTKVIVQGITGQAGSFHTGQCLDYGTKIVAGVTPGKGGSKIFDIPVFNTLIEAVKYSNTPVESLATAIFVPASFAFDAILESIECDIKVIVCITEGIPTIDMIKARMLAKEKKLYIIGPNCPGIITVEECKIGIMPGYIHKKGNIGVVSRSGTLTYEAVYQLTKHNLGQSTVVGIGGDPVVGTTMVEVLQLFENDPQTETVLLIGEIGGRAEEDAADFYSKFMKKKLFAFIAGQTSPPGKRMGHAGAIIDGTTGTAGEKISYLKSKNISVITSPALIGETISKYVKN